MFLKTPALATNLALVFMSSPVIINQVDIVFWPPSFTTADVLKQRNFSNSFA
jgi:hypothetical protein